MQSIVGVDAASKNTGEKRCLIGVSIVLNDRQQFQDHYLQTVNEFYNEYGIARENAVIKSDHLSRLLPSYELSQARADIQRLILDTTAIERIHTTICWYDGEVETPLSEFSGGQFINRFVKPYFPIVALWRYHRSQRQYDPATTAVVDSFSGKITKAWKYVGNSFDLSIVPKGDMIYPVLSSADLIVSALSRILPDSIDYSDYESHVDGWLLERLPDTDNQFVQTHLLSQESPNNHIEHIKPHKYDVRPHLSYPHPVIFVEESVLSGKDREAIDRSQLMGVLCNRAREIGGAVTKFDVEHFPFIVQDGDYIVYNPVDPTKAKTLQNLHPRTEINLVSAAGVTNGLVNE